MGFIKNMMKLVLLTAHMIVAHEDSLRKIYATPGVISAESLIQPPQQINGLEALAKNLKLGDEHSLKIEKTRTLRNSCMRHKLRIYYKGLPVRVFTIQATEDSNGIFTGAVSGYVLNITSLDTTVYRKHRDLKCALADLVDEKAQNSGFNDSVTAADIVKFEARKQIDVDLITGKAAVVYLCRGFVATCFDNYFPRAVIDAKTGYIMKSSVDVFRLLDIKSTITLDIGTRPTVRGGNDKCPGPNYGPNSNQILDICTLSNKNFTVYTLNNQNDRRKAEVVKFLCSKGPNDSINGAGSPSLDVYHYSEKFYDMVDKWGSTFIQLAQPLSVIVHSGLNYQNSYYDGGNVVFGDGSSNLYPLTVPDAIGHELGHVFVDTNNVLEFRDESLAVNEAFCDTCGKSLVAFSSPTYTVDNWNMAGCAVKQVNLSLRYFDHPEKDNFTISNVDSYNGEIQPYRFVGVFDNVFYRLVQDKGIPINIVFKIFVHAMELYWNELSGLLDAACGVYRSASDLQLNTADFFSSFEAVGIHLGFCNLNGTKT